ncbi:hypothetical protein F3Y22_tig00004205pilonHSYRG00005 [Hibiscus syriacus]|uniref:Uncharacterized protein n=1 Tax=Hibiscus syriacus TaxID=106335 RepID=A0A6A3CJB4_HIBSY|nr:hypothetical protein F3Y22_tig00004205pilonHSYRG00005 [Hibiscus syriacus]
MLSCSYNRANIRVTVIGDLPKLPEALQELILNLEETTKNNTHFQLIIAELQRIAQNSPIQTYSYDQRRVYSRQFHVMAVTIYRVILCTNTMA